MKLNTVNVVEVEDNCILQIFSFTDDEKGSKEAEKVFKKLVRKAGDRAVKNVVSENEVEVSLEDGYYRFLDYSVYIEHSV